MELKEARKAERYSAQQVADIMGVCRVTYVKWEEHPELVTVGNAEKLAELFKVPVTDLFLASNYS